MQYNLVGVKAASLLGREENNLKRKLKCFIELQLPITLKYNWITI